MTEYELLPTAEMGASPDEQGEAKFQFDYSATWGWLNTMVGLGPTRTSLIVTDTMLLVKFGYAFAAEIPLESIAKIDSLSEPFMYSLGVHGAFGTYLVNGSMENLVTLEMEPEQKCRLAFGLAFSLSKLVVSVRDKNQFMKLLGERTGIEPVVFAQPPPAP